MEFLKSKFEILLLAFFVLFFSTAVILGCRHGMSGIVDFAIDNNKTFGGALLMALTGRALATRNGDKNGNGTPPAA